MAKFKIIPKGFLGVVAVLSLTFAIFAIVYEVVGQMEAPCPLIRAQCADQSSNQRNADLVNNMFFCESWQLYVYSPECRDVNPSQRNTQTCIAWTDNFTELRNGNGNPDLNGAQCKSVRTPGNPGDRLNFIDNADIPSDLICTSGREGLNRVYWTEECVGYTKTIVPVATIIGISLGSCAGLILVVGIICCIFIRKRTKKQEQEKGEKMAKVVVLDAPVPPPLYGGSDHDDDLGLQEFSDEDDDYVKHLKSQGALSTKQSGRHLGAYAKPDLSLYGQEAQDVDEQQFEDLNEHLELGEHRRFYGDEQGRSYGNPDQSHYPNYYGGAPAKRQSTNERGEDKFARAAIVDRIESRSGVASGSTAMMAMPRDKSMKSMGEESDFNPYSYDRNESSPSIRLQYHHPMTSTSSKFAAPSHDRPGSFDNPYGTQSGYGTRPTRATSSRSQPKGRSQAGRFESPSTTPSTSDVAGRRARKNAFEMTPKHHSSRTQRNVSSASPRRTSNWGNNGSRSGRNREQKYGYGEFH